MKPSTVITSVIALFLLIGTVFFLHSRYSDIPGNGDSSSVISSGVIQRTPVFSAGEASFSQKELELAAKLVSLSYPSEKDPEAVALSQLIEGSLYVSVLQEVGSPITDDILKTESDRIDSSTHDSKKLDEIKAVFSGDINLYRKIAILPGFANSIFHYRVFPKLDVATQESREQTSGILEKLKSGGTLPDGVTSRKLGFSPIKGFLPPEMPGLLPEVVMQKSEEEATFNTQMDQQANTEAEKYEKEVFTPTPKGEWFSKLIENTESYELVRWTEQTSTGRTVEIVSIPKKSSFEYFDEKKKDIPVWIPNASLKEQFLARIPWAKDLKWKEGK